VLLANLLTLVVFERRHLKKAVFSSLLSDQTPFLAIELLDVHTC
jgi:hypothetical protein